MQAKRSEFGRMPGGEVVEMVELVRPGGTTLRVMTLGATMHTLTAPDRSGTYENVVLNHPAFAPYLERPQFLGSIVGRFANRIGHASFELDGTRYDLGPNEGANILHGGAGGFHRVLWHVEDSNAGSEPSVRLAYLSPDGEQGFPGELRATVTYALTGTSELTITLEATTNRPTVVSLTSHPYFTLDGVGRDQDVLSHRLSVDANGFTPVDDAMIPTGEIRDVSGTPFDLRRPQRLQGCVSATEDAQVALAGGFDHNFALVGGHTPTPRSVARLEAPRTGRVLELHTTEPGLQVYTGQKLGGAGAPVHERTFGAIALEPQAFPDAPNQPGFPSARLDPGETYRHVSVYRFGVVS